MRNISETYNVYPYNEISEEAKEKARQWWIECESADQYPWWNDAFSSLQQFCDWFDVSVKDYSVGAYSPSYINLDLDRYDTEWGTCYDDNAVPGLSYVRLWRYLHNMAYPVDKLLSKSCPFTGYCADEDILQPIREFVKKPDHRTYAELINDCVDSWLYSVVQDMEYRLSDEAAEEALSDSDYEFTESGEIY